MIVPKLGTITCETNTHAIAKVPTNYPNEKIFKCVIWWYNTEQNLD